MRILIQRVSEAWVEFEGQRTDPAGDGLLCLVGFNIDDKESIVEPMLNKLLYLRVFEDEMGKMNRSLLETGGSLVLVPQFTLYADCRKGRRPGFGNALAPEHANSLFKFLVELGKQRVPHATQGKFGADMKVHLTNDGPVTILLDSDELNLTGK